MNYLSIYFKISNFFYCLKFVSNSNALEIETMGFILFIFVRNFLRVFFVCVSWYMSIFRNVPLMLKGRYIFICVAEFYINPLTLSVIYSQSSVFCNFSSGILRDVCSSSVVRFWRTNFPCTSNNFCFLLFLFFFFFQYNGIWHTNS